MTTQFDWQVVGNEKRRLEILQDIITMSTYETDKPCVNGVLPTIEQLETLSKNDNIRYLFLMIKTKKYPNFIPIGYMEIQQLGESEVRLENIGIIPSFRNNGYATYFIKTILKQYAIDAKIKYCLLNVWCENKSAIAVYTKIGFKVLCVRSDHWEKNIHAYYMQLIINDK